MHKSVVIRAVAAAALVASTAAHAQPMYTQGNRPVMLIADEDGWPPCTAAMISTGDPASGGVMVFPGDSTDLDFIDSLVDGDPVWLCDVADEMVGIVYSSDPDIDCELTTPDGEDRPYLGPCDWGWVMPQWVAIDTP